MIAGSLITWAATQHGARPSLVLPGRSYSHAEVEALSNQFAHALLASGLAPGERLAVLLENSVESVLSVFGAEKAGLTYVALNARHAPAEQLAILRDAGAAAVVLGPQFAALAPLFLDAVGSELPELRLVLGQDLATEGVVDLAALCAKQPVTPPGIEIEPEHALRIAYTSGTTGHPKGVLYTAERTQTRLNNHFMAMEYGLSVDDAMLHVGPLTHAAGVYLFPCFLRGARNIIQDRFDPAALLHAVAQYRVTHLMLVPTMMKRLVDAIEGGLTGDWSSLRRIHYGTAPTPVALIRRTQAIFGPVLRQQYGMTEAVQPLCVLYPHEHLGDTAEAPVGSCGRPSAQVRIVLRDARGLPVPQGEVGEITLAHEGVARVDFWRRPDLLTESVRGGWFYTGDLGRFDAQGYLYIVGRNKDMIISGGFNIYAREVEDALSDHPEVAEVAVLGLPDPEWGELVAAAVVLREGATLAALEPAGVLGEHIGRQIAGYKKPRRYALLPALPRNHAGKVLKTELLAYFGSST